MSKDFEQAYKELAQNEVPDLWDRIEAGLSERSTSEKEEGQRKIKKFYFRQYAGIAAAAVCVVLIAPAVLFLGGQSSKSAGDACAPEMAAEGIAEEAEAAAEEWEDVAETAEEAVYETTDEAETGTVHDMAETPVQDFAFASGGVVESVADKSRELENTADDMGNKEEAKDNNKMDELEAAMPQTAKKLQAEDGAVLEHVRIQVLDEGKSVDGGTDLEGMGDLYRAVVEEDASGNFAQGEEIEIFVPVYSSAALVKNGVFEVDLIYRDKEAYSLVLQKFSTGIEE